MRKEYPIKLTVAGLEPPKQKVMSHYEYYQSNMKATAKPISQNWAYDSALYQQMSKSSGGLKPACPGPGWIWCPGCKVWCGKCAHPDQPQLQCKCCTKKAKQAKQSAAKPFTTPW